MSPLEQLIIETINREGRITFEKFMDMALYEPGLGYYSTGKARVGRSGDFYTSSHLHPAFGLMLAKQVEEMWENMERPADFGVVEIGSGAGYLCLDMMTYLSGREIFPHMNYIIVERNPLQQQRQRELTDRFGDKVRWTASLAGVRGIYGCILSNELLDAFPVHVVCMKDKLEEVYVTFDGSSFREETGPLSTPALNEYFDDISVVLEKGYRTEVNLGIKDWLGEVEAALSRGYLLTVDYGYSSRDYYSEDRSRGTLLCYHRHELNEDPLALVGEQDITAHVNFSSLKKWGEESGLTAAGYCSQGMFLLSLGIDEEIKRLHSESGDYASELGRIKQLIMPQGLGESHMVMAQRKGDFRSGLSGFRMTNRLRYL